jgi:hypothetical protein
MYCDCAPQDTKQAITHKETLDEAAERYVKDSSHELYELRKQSFIDGAKYQKEKILQFLYDEITERRGYSASKMCEKIIEFINNNR